MSPSDFVYWLNGLFELTPELARGEAYTLSAEQVKTIKDHVSLVLSKKTAERFVAGPPSLPYCGTPVRFPPTTQGTTVAFGPDETSLLYRHHASC